METMTEEIVKISRGNPGAVAFAIDAVKYNIRDARRVFSRMESINVVGDRLYMLWNDCCDRNTLLTMAIAAYAPTEMILGHINYENGRGIPFLDSEFEMREKKTQTKLHTSKLRAKMYVRKQDALQQSILDIKGRLCARMAEKLCEVVEVRESFEENCVVYEAEVTVLTREDKSVLKFKCDRCGKEIARDEAWAIVLATGAYAAEGSKKRTQGEICGDCAEIILKEMIYLDEVPAQDCRVASLLAMTEGEVPAQDCRIASLLAMTEREVHARDCTRKGYAESVALVPRERLRNHGAEKIEMTDEEGHAPQDDSRTYEKKEGDARNEGRYIMIARKRAGMKADELAGKLYISVGTLKGWERGMTKKLHWDEIETVLPEVKEIREKGCEAFCPSPKACLGGGKCYYSGKKV